MEKKQFEHRVARIREVAKVIVTLPPEIRVAAFNLLEGYVSSTEQPTQSAGTPRTQPTSKAASPLDTEAFFQKFQHDRPSENAKLVAAYLYSLYGSDPFPQDDIRKIADDVGITVPGRVDMTLLAAKEKGKKLFARAGRGSFKPTVNGEGYFKATYSVTQGTKKRPEPPK